MNLGEAFFLGVHKKVRKGGSKKQIQSRKHRKIGNIRIK